MSPAELRPSRAQAQESTLQSAMIAFNTAHTAPGRQLPVMVHSPGLHHPMAYLHAQHELTLCTAMDAGLFIKSLSQVAPAHAGTIPCNGVETKGGSRHLSHQFISPGSYQSKGRVYTSIGTTTCA